MREWTMPKLLYNQCLPSIQRSLTSGQQLGIPQTEYLTIHLLSHSSVKITSSSYRPHPANWILSLKQEIMWGKNLPFIRILRHIVAGTPRKWGRSSSNLQSLGLAVELSKGSLQKGSSILLQNQHLIPEKKKKQD